MGFVELFVVCMMLRGKVNAYNKQGNKIGKISGATLISHNKGFKEKNILLYIEEFGLKELIPLEKAFFKEEEILKRIDETKNNIKELKIELNETENPFAIKEIEEDILTNEKCIEILSNYVSSRKIS